MAHDRHADGVAVYVRVGHLEGHPDRQAHIGEVAVARMRRAGEVDAPLPRVVEVRVAKSEDRMDHEPREHRAEHGDQDEERTCASPDRAAFTRTNPTPAKLATQAPSSSRSAVAREASSAVACAAVDTLSIGMMVSHTQATNVAAVASHPPITAICQGEKIISTAKTKTPTVSEPKARNRKVAILPASRFTDRLCHARAGQVGMQADDDTVVQ